MEKLINRREFLNFSALTGTVGALLLKKGLDYFLPDYRPEDASKHSCHEITVGQRAEIYPQFFKEEETIISPEAWQKTSPVLERIASSFYDYNENYSKEMSFDQYYTAFLTKVRDLSFVHQVDFDLMIAMLHHTSFATTGLSDVSVGKAQLAVRKFLNLITGSGEDSLHTGSLSFLADNLEPEVKAWLSPFGGYFAMIRLNGHLTLGVLDHRSLFFAESFANDNNLKRVLGKNYFWVWPVYADLLESSKKYQAEKAGLSALTDVLAESQPELVSDFFDKDRHDEVFEVIGIGPKLSLRQKSEVGVAWRVNIEANADLSEQAIAERVKDELMAMGPRGLIRDQILNWRFLRYLREQSSGESRHLVEAVIQQAKRLKQTEIDCLSKDETAVAVTGPMELNDDFQLLTVAAYVKECLRKVQAIRLENKEKELDLKDLEQKKAAVFYIYAIREQSSIRLTADIFAYGAADVPYNYSGQIQALIVLEKKLGIKAGDNFKEFMSEVELLSQGAHSDRDLQKYYDEVLIAKPYSSITFAVSHILSFDKFE